MRLTINSLALFIGLGILGFEGGGLHGLAVALVASGIIVPVVVGLLAVIAGRLVARAASGLRGDRDE